MARSRFTVGTRYLHNKQVYIVRQLLLDNKVQVENQSFGGLVILTQEELVDIWAKGEVIFEVYGRHTKVSEDTHIATEYTLADFQKLERGWEEAWRRYQLILPLLKELTPRKPTRKVIKEYAVSLAPKTSTPTSSQSTTTTPLATRESPRKGKAIGQAISRTSIERWLKDFVESGFDIRSLVPETYRYGGKGKTRLDSECEKIISEVLEECKKHPANRTVVDVFDNVVNGIAKANASLPPGKQLKPPGPATVYHRVDAAGKEAILRRRPSRLEAQADSSVNPGPRPTRISERVEIDDTRLDLIVVDEEDRLPIGRPTLSFALDGYSAFPYGIYVGFEPASYRTAQECLLHAILPKPDCQQVYGTKHPWPVYGLPETLIVDNGDAFKNRHLKDACGQLGIILEHMPVKKPWFKGRIERFFRTNNKGLIHSLPGTTFSNILERGDYDSFRHSCISLSGFIELLHVFFLDRYAREFHKGAGQSGGIPAKLWEESMQSGYLPYLHHSARELRIILYRSEERTVQRSGIDYESLRYQSPNLAPLRSRLHDDEQVHVKINPSDLSTIYVYDKYNDDGGWLPVPAVDQEYTQGLSLWKHRVIRGYVLRQKREVDIYELAAAKKHIQEIVAREYALTRKGRGRATAARFLGIGAEATQTSAPSTSDSSRSKDEQARAGKEKEARNEAGSDTGTTAIIEPQAPATTTKGEKWP
jgi:putative transposase